MLLARAKNTNRRQRREVEPLLAVVLVLLVAAHAKALTAAGPLTLTRRPKKRALLWTQKTKINKSTTKKLGFDYVPRSVFGTAI